MAEYLTQGWLDECRRLGADLPERPGASARIQYVISGSDPIEYFTIFEDGRIISSALGTLGDADVVLTMTHRDSIDIQKGDLDANEAFSAGTIGFTGDMRMLMSLLPILWPSPTRRLASARRYQALQAQIRAMTEYRNDGVPK